MTELVMPSIVVVIATFVATVTDVRTLKVHNLLTFPLLLGGMMYHFFTGGVEGLLLSFVAAFVSFLVLFVPYLAGGMGAGDVKLVAALGAWLGMPMIIGVIAAGLFLTAAYALAKLTWQGRLADAWLQLKVSLIQLSSLTACFAADDKRERVHEMAKSPIHRKRLIPFSAMLFLGLLMTLVWTYVSSTGPYSY